MLEHLCISEYSEASHLRIRTLVEDQYRVIMHIGTLLYNGPNAVYVRYWKDFTVHAQTILILWEATYNRWIASYITKIHAQKGKPWSNHSRHAFVPRGRAIIFGPCMHQLIIIHNLAVWYLWPNSLPSKKAKAVSSAVKSNYQLIVMVCDCALSYIANTWFNPITAAIVCSAEVKGISNTL